MSLRQSFGRRRPMRNARLRFEALEPRVVLDAQLGLDAEAEPDDGSLPPDQDDLGLAHFGSADELEDFLIADALVRWDGLFGQPAWSWWGCYDCYYVMDTAVDGVAVPSAVNSPSKG